MWFLKRNFLYFFILFFYKGTAIEQLFLSFRSKAQVFFANSIGKWIIRNNYFVYFLKNLVIELLDHFPKNPCGTPLFLKNSSIFDWLSIKYTGILSVKAARVPR